jgi:N-acetylmuramoyl-L-alanine amidase
VKLGLIAMLVLSGCQDRSSEPVGPIPVQVSEGIPPSKHVPPDAGPPPPTWPQSSAALTPPQVVFPEGFGKHKIFLDPGHGNPGNSGNESCTCVEEQSFNLEIGKHLKAALEASGHFQVKLSRSATSAPKYRVRLAAARATGAEVFLSLHSDVRGDGVPAASKDGRQCYSNPDAPGFSVLWSDEGKPALVAKRKSLARVMASKMAGCGMTPYSGEDYEGLYEGDPDAPGVFVDRHVPSQRIFFLHAPPMPSIIIETHHAWDPLEEARFQERATRDAFSRAVLAGLIGFYAAASAR